MSTDVVCDDVLVYLMGDDLGVREIDVNHSLDRALDITAEKFTYLHE